MPQQQPTEAPLILKPPFRHRRGHGWEATLPAALEGTGNTADHPYRSRLRLLEDGKALGHPYASWLDIAYAGGGAYNQLDTLLFSTSDNTDPNSNGRTYAITHCAPPDDALPLPRRVHVVLSMSCNLWCRICRPEPFRGPFMSMALFEKIADELFPTTAQLRLDSGGELLLNPDLPRILRLVSRYGTPFFSSSNGMLLTADNARLLAESSLHHIQISLDSPDKETLEWIRRGARFERIIEGVKRLVAARREVGRPFLITFHAAVMRKNVRQLPELVRLAHELGVEGVTGNHVFCHGCTDPELSCYWDQAEYDEMREKTIETARRLGSFFYGPASFASVTAAEAASAPRPDFCIYPEHGTYINPDGSVMACCMAPILTLGSLAEQSFNDIWTGERYQRLRETYRSAHPVLARCKDCLGIRTTTENWQSYFAPEHWASVRAKLHQA